MNVAERADAAPDLIPGIRGEDGKDLSIPSFGYLQVDGGARLEPRFQLRIGGEEWLGLIRREAIEPEFVPRVVLLNRRKNRLGGRVTHLRNGQHAVVFHIDRVGPGLSGSTEMEGVYRDTTPFPPDTTS